LTAIAVVLQHVGDVRRARRAVRLAEQELRRLPARVHRRPALDELRERVRVLVDAEEVARLGAARRSVLQPVPTASTNTRSLVSSNDDSLVTSGAVGRRLRPASFGTATRTGPNEPMCSQIVDEPGPPFHRNVTGRRLATPPSALYAT
jgi:hypothetical protein